MAEHQKPIEAENGILDTTNNNAIATTLIKEMLDELETRVDTTKETSLECLKSRLMNEIPSKEIDLKDASDLRDVFKILKEFHGCSSKAFECFCDHFLNVDRKSATIMQTVCVHIKKLVTGQDISTIGGKGDIFPAVTTHSDSTLEECQTFNKHQARNDTFLYSKSTHGKDIDSMSEAGIYTTGDEDESRCYHCEVFRRDWKPGDDPWRDHDHTNTICPYIRSTQRQDSLNKVATMTQTTTKRRMKMGHLGAKQRGKRTLQPHITKYFSKVKRGSKTLVNTPKKVTSFFRRRKWIDRNTNKGGQNIRKFSKSKFQQGVETPHCAFQSDNDIDPSCPITTRKPNSATMPTNVSATDPADNPKAAENIDGIVIAEPDITVETKPEGVSSNTTDGTVLNNNGVENGENSIAANKDVCNITTFTLPQSNVADNQEACNINARTVPGNIIEAQHVDEITKNEDNISDAADIDLRYTEENTRRETYINWPPLAYQGIGRLVTAGFFYTGQTDTVRCCHCDIEIAQWSSDDDPWKEHARHSPDCPYLKEKKGEDYVSHIQAELSKIYLPRHPLLTKMDARYQTFDSSWQCVTHSPEQMAAAGFFYTGEGDTVQCHYCDGGLSEWEPQDEPWTEHARWFPFCKFVLTMKGMEFIQAVTESMDSCCSTETLTFINEFQGNSDTYDFEEEMLSSPAKEIGYIAGHRTRMNWENRTRLDQIGILDINNAADSMKNILDEDEDDERVDMDSKQTQEYNVNRELESMEDTDSMDTHEVSDKDNEIIQNSSVETSTRDSDQIRGLDLSVETLVKENEFLKERTKCKMCCQDQVHLLFLPCGHLVACRQCGKRASKCIDCNVTVSTRLNILV